MIDIHCHILHDVDDGPSTMEESIALARFAYEDGIRHVIATPHFTLNYFNHRGLVERKTAELQRELDRLGIGIALYPGNEVRLESEAFVERHTREAHYCLLGPTGRFVLLEQRWNEYEEQSVEVVQSFVRMGITPIVPHPERHGFFRRQPELLDRLVQAGAWTQVTADSLLGNNGAEAQAFAFGLLERDMAHTLATDAHNARRRPNLSFGYEIVRERAGERRVAAIEERMRQIMPL